MTRSHQLEASLTTLRLSGMLDTLQARLGQAQAGELGHLEFLQVLCEDEIARRDTAALERRLRAAHFESAATIEDFDFSFNPKIPAAHIRDLATLRFVDAGESVVLHGPVGVGKSMIAQARPATPTRPSRPQHDVPPREPHPNRFGPCFGVAAVVDLLEQRGDSCGRARRRLEGT